MTRSVAIIMVGGPTKGTRFRPLSFNVAKPIFPLAGQPMVHHPIQACKKIPDLVHIYLVGFYEEKEFQLYVSSLSTELKVPVRYLKEDKARGSAGGLSHFRDVIMEDDPDMLFVLNCDVCCSFPLAELQDAQRRHNKLGTILVKKVSKEKAAEFGELVADGETKELLHYTEKPDTFVSDLINCGVYVFSSSLFDHISSVSTVKRDTATLKRASSFEVMAIATTTRDSAAEFVRLDQDVLTPLAGKQQLYVYETQDFWEQIKTPGMALRCSGLYLGQYRRTNPSLLATPDASSGPAIVGDVYVHPSAKIHPTAKLGPNVAVAANARIGAGVRLISCIILDGVEIKENACVMHSIVGWKSTIGRWSRVQGAGDYEAKLGITILGEDNIVEDEVVVVNCIVLPHKSISRTVREEIIL